MHLLDALNIAGGVAAALPAGRWIFRCYNKPAWWDPFNVFDTARQWCGKEWQW